MIKKNYKNHFEFVGFFFNNSDKHKTVFHKTIREFKIVTNQDNPATLNTFPERAALIHSYMLSNTQTY